MRALGRRAAIKILHPEFSHNQDVAARFFNEARAVNIIKHPGIVDISDYGQLPSGVVFIVMEFLEGDSLHLRLERMGGRLPREVALRFGQQISATLDVAHQKGIVHRDLKPQNVMIVADPMIAGGERTKVLDFGIAKLSESGQHQRTRTGAMMGTPSYMSPEQCREAAHVDGKSDVYSLGVMFYQMLVGRLPFTAPSTVELMMQHMGTPPPSVRAADPTLPAVMDGLVMRMMAKDPTERPAMAQVAAELQHLSTAVGAELPSWGAAGAQTLQTLVVAGNAAPPREEPRPIERGVASAPPQQSGWAAPVPAQTTGGRRLLWAGLVAGPLVLGGIGLAFRYAPDPSPSVRREGEAAKMLLNIDADLRNRRWDDAIGKLDRILQIPALAQQYRDTATTKRDKAEAEKKTQALYDRFMAAGGKDYDEALGIYREIPADSVYRPMATETYNKIIPLFAESHLKQAEDARLAGDCPKFSEQVQKVLTIAPDHIRAQTIKSQSCPDLAQPSESATSPTPRHRQQSNVVTQSTPHEGGGKKTIRPPKEGSSEVDAEKILDAAQSAYVNGYFNKALVLALPISRSGGGTQVTRAWRIIGGAACSLKDFKLINDAWRRLDNKSRQSLAYVCMRAGVRVTDGQGPSWRNDPAAVVLAPRDSGWHDSASLQ